MASARRIVRVLTLVMAVVCSGAAFGESPVAFIGGVVIDGNGGTPVENGVVLVRDGRIEAVGEAARVRVPTDARVIDLEGRAVMPGLADMHVHLMGGWDGVGSDWLGYQRYLNALLYSGVTTVFDLGNVMPFVLQLRDEVAAGTIAGPRIYCVGLTRAPGKTGRRIEARLDRRNRRLGCITGATPCGPRRTRSI